MSNTTTAVPVRRVRHEVRDSLTMMLFTAIASCGFAVLLMLVVQVGN